MVYRPSRQEILEKSERQIRVHMIVLRPLYNSGSGRAYSSSVRQEPDFGYIRHLPLRTKLAGGIGDVE